MITIPTEFINLIAPKLLPDLFNPSKKSTELFSLVINSSNVQDLKRITLDII